MTPRRRPSTQRRPSTTRAVRGLNPIHTLLRRTALSMAMAPPILLLLSMLAKKVKFRIRMEGITRKYQYGDTFQT